jgi:hypothetical protein
MHLLRTLGVTLGLTHSVVAHGYLKSVEVNGQSYLVSQCSMDV